MPEPLKPEEEIVKLNEQIENLNKGIASYRDETKASKDAVDASRKEIADLKKSIDELKAKPDSKKEDTKLSPEEEKKFEALMKQKGIVTKDEMDQERNRIFNENVKNIENQAVSEFLEKHPEYDKDEEWKKVEAEFALYRTPTSITGFRTLLAKIHRDLSGDGDDKAKARAKADITNRQRLGLGGGSQKSGDGDAEASIDALQKRYPNLSREQIEARKGEIDALYAKKK